MAYLSASFVLLRSLFVSACSLCSLPSVYVCVYHSVIKSFCVRLFTLFIASRICLYLSFCYEVFMCPTVFFVHCLAHLSASFVILLSLFGSVCPFSSFPSVPVCSFRSATKSF